MSDNDIPIDGLIALEPTPDEEAWEAYLLFALENLEATEETAIDMRTLAAIERAVGVRVPFEVGLLLVIGVPDAEGWFRWGDDPAAELVSWNERTLGAILDDVEHRQFWSEAWGARPADEEVRARRVRKLYADAAPVLPLYRNRVVPLVPAAGETAAESNPVLALDGASVTTAGTDIAAWITNEFGVPLPMWPETPPRTFTFWSDLLS